jgi:hypothetical protein
VISDEFAAEVQELRDEGWTWPEISELTGKPQRTCQRAIGVGHPEKRCAHKGCDEPALHSGRYCSPHARLKMRYRPGQGIKQQEVMRVMRRHGVLRVEQIRQMTGQDVSGVGQVLGRLVKLGLLERPNMGIYKLPSKDT